MDRSDFKRFAMTLTACAELYGKTISEGAMQLWWQSLERFEIEQVQRAFRAVVESPDGGQFMPKPADIIKALDGNSTDRSLIAWGKVLDAMSRVGAYQSVAFDDPAIHAAIVDLGGWVTLCRTQNDEMPFVQRRFCDAHKTYSHRPDMPYPAVLQGESEQANRARGISKAPSPTLIGDQSKASRVAASGGVSREIGALGSSVVRSIGMDRKDAA